MDAVAETVRHTLEPMRFPWALAALIDLVLVVVFAAIGMANHGEAVLPGLFVVAWPFVAGAVIGWLVGLAWKAPVKPLRTGIPVWIAAAGVGMVLRVLTGGGFAVSFLIVTAIVLGVFLVGWRALATLIGRARSRAGSHRPAP